MDAEVSARKARTTLPRQFESLWRGKEYLLISRGRIRKSRGWWRPRKNTSARSMRAADTNVLVRLVVRDSPEASPAPRVVHRE